MEAAIMQQIYITCKEKSEESSRDRYTSEHKLVVNIRVRITE